ncbi:hypothetical protein Sjap_018997 [Stephania japonica]|uniref:Uncharacterized protein n=1 Tax=Stephania japonica TaxID=461633 RepID=A0AAP0HUB1_9MAGN
MGLNLIRLEFEVQNVSYAKNKIKIKIKMTDPSDSLTQKLVDHPQQQQQHQHQHPLSTLSRLLQILSEPLQWLRMLCRELNTSFVLGRSFGLRSQRRLLGLTLQSSLSLLLERCSESSTIAGPALHRLLSPALDHEAILGSLDRCVPPLRAIEDALTLS